MQTGIDIAKSYPFANLAKAWSLDTNALVLADLGAFDRNGFPNNASITSPFRYQNSAAPLAHVGTSGWVISFQGTGAFQLFGVNVSTLTVTSLTAGAVFSGSNATLSTGTNNTGTTRVAFHATSGQLGEFNPSFPTGFTYSGMSNLIFCRSGDETNILAGGASGIIFNQDYANAVNSLNPSAIRSFGWTYSNGMSLSNWVDRLPLSAVSWQNLAVDPNLLLSSSGAISGSGTYTATSYPNMPGGGSYVDGECCEGYVTVTNAGSGPTLNVGSRGAVTIVSQGGGTIGASGLTINQLYTFTYNALLNQWVATPQFNITNVPLEVAIAFANQIGCDVWWNIPQFFTDSSITSAVAYAASNLNPGLTFIVEWANEVWNYGGGTFATPLSDKWAVAIGLGTDIHNSYYGYRCRKIFGNIKTQWASAGTSAKLRCMLVGQLYGAGFDSSQTQRFAGSELNTTSNPSYIGPNYSTAGQRPIDFADALSFAHYWSGNNVSNNFSAPTAAQTPFIIKVCDDYNSTDAVRQDNALRLIDWDVRQGTAQGGDGPTGGQTIVELPYSRAQAVCTQYAGTGNVPAAGLPLDCYEGACEATWYKLSFMQSAGIDPASWASGTTYSTGQTVVASDNNTYSSVGNGNIGHNPVGDGGVNWTLVGLSYFQKLQNVVTAYKASVYFQATYSYHLGVFKSFPNFRAPSNSSFAGAVQWAMYPGDIYGSTYTNFNSAQTFNNIGYSPLELRG